MFCGYYFRRTGGGGLLSLSQQQLQNQQQQQQQRDRGVIGQLPSLSMQGHSSPTGSPGLNINSSRLPNQPLNNAPQQQQPPPKSSVLPLSSSSVNVNTSTSIPNVSSNPPGMIGGQFHRSMSANNLGAQQVRVGSN